MYSSVVAHGRNTGAEYARSFSNQPRSNKSSLGFYITQETYFGAHGLSLKLDGFEKGINDMARERAIVMHGADYAHEKVISRKGYLGRSFGCPAVPPHLTKKIIEKIKNGNCLFVYYPDKKYLKGIVTNRDLRFEKDLTKLVRDVMTADLLPKFIYTWSRSSK